MKKIIGKPLFYGWWIVGGGAVILFFNAGIVIMSVQVFIKPVSEALGTSRLGFSLYATILSLAAMIAGPFIGKSLEKVNVRLIMGVANLAIVLAYVFFSKCQTIFQFYLLSILLGVGFAGGSVIPITIVITNWIVKKRALAIGIIASASGIGGIVFNPVSSWLITAYGWRNAYMILGLVIGVICIPIAVLFMRKSPEELGLLPDGAKPDVSIEKQPKVEGYKFREAIKLPVFWMLAASCFLLFFCCIGIQNHIHPYLTDLGHSPETAAFIVSSWALGLSVGKIVLGYFTDQQGIPKMYMSFMLIALCSIFILFKADSLWIAFTGATLFGFATSLAYVMPPLMTAECFGMLHYGVFFAWIMIFMQLGAGIGMPLSGWIYDTTGTYKPAFVLYIFMNLLSMILAIAAMKRSEFSRKLIA